MNGLNFLAIVGATVAAFVFASIWYIALDRQRKQLSAGAAAQGRPPRWMMPVELVRTFIVALAVALVGAGLASRLGGTGPASGILLALVLWLGFPVILLTGSVIYENVPAKLAAIHAGDWLGKLLIVAIIVSVWR